MAAASAGPGENRGSGTRSLRVSKDVVVEDSASSNKDPVSSADTGVRTSLGQLALILALVVFGVFYMMLAMGGASFVHECQTVVCGQLHQAIFAAVGALALFVGAYRLLEGKSSAQIIFLGTVPILIVHVVLVMTDPNEAIFFPLSTTPPPLISGLRLLYRRGGVDRPSVAGR